MALGVLRVAVCIDKPFLYSRLHMLICATMK